jgi:hypothetical protein
LGTAQDSETESIIEVNEEESGSTIDPKRPRRPSDERDKVHAIS